MVIFGLKPWVNPFRKCPFFDFLNFLFLYARKVSFCSRISQNTFSWSIFPKKKNVGKMAIFGLKPWVNPFRKCQFFDFLNFLFLYARKVSFCSRIS